MEQEAAKAAALIADAAHDDTRKPYKNDEFDAEVQFIKDWVSLRPSQVLLQVAKARMVAPEGYAEALVANLALITAH